MPTSKLAQRKSSGSRRSVIVGPILSDLRRLGWGGNDVVLATAFYSYRALQSFSLTSNALQVLCRLDTKCPNEWAKGMLDPDALLARLRSLEKIGTTIDLRVHKSAHAKVYLGQHGVMIGSANLTLQGFGGAWEIVQTSNVLKDIQKMRMELKGYSKTLEKFTLDDLEDYVEKHKTYVREYRRKHRGGRFHDRVSAPKVRPPRLGDYSDFLVWLKRQKSPAAIEICDRANGKSNLQGHIHRNFFGLRQFLLAYTEHLQRFSNQDPNTYKLSKEPSMELELKHFVNNNAANEASFSLNTWKTYLPLECGGRAGKHGGTIGNLNRMLPLVARYLVRKTSQ
jgi:hypothetical protein